MSAVIACHHPDHYGLDHWDSHGDHDRGEWGKKNPEAQYKWLSIQLSLCNLSHKNEVEIHAVWETIYYTAPVAQ